MHAARVHDRGRGTSRRPLRVRGGPGRRRRVTPAREAPCPASARPARLDRAQLDQAVQSAVKIAIGDRDLINGPIIMGIIAYPQDGELAFQQLQGIDQAQAGIQSAKR